MQISIGLFSIGETPRQNAANIAHPRNSILGERTTIPTIKELLQPELAKNVADEIHIRRQHTKLWYDRTAKALPELVIG